MMVASPTNLMSIKKESPEVQSLVVVKEDWTVDGAKYQELGGPEGKRPQAVLKHHNLNTCINSSTLMFRLVQILENLKKRYILNLIF